MVFLPLLLACLSPTGAGALVSEDALAAASQAATTVRELLASGDNGGGSGSWGERADLLGLLVRLPFHDGATFENETGGSDGCVDLESLENRGLQEAIDLLAPIHAATAGQLSRADVWALAGNVAIEAAGGPHLQYRLGRKDKNLNGGCVGQGSRHVSSESTSSEALEEVFVNKLKFTHRQTVALLGAHVLGKASKANSGYRGPWVRNNAEFTNAYFADLLKEPWIKETETVSEFGERTTWRRFVDRTMSLEDEIMLQTDVDLAFQTTGGYFCSRVGGRHNPGSSCPEATHPFAAHVRDFADDEAVWLSEFATAWAKLTEMTVESLACTTAHCKTPLPTDVASASRTLSTPTACIALGAITSAISSLRN